MNSESESYIFLLDGHLKQMTQGLTRFPADKWDWNPAPCAPSAKQLAEHTLEWLICDRRHIMVPDAQFHDEMPPTPPDQASMLRSLNEEREEWVKMLNQLRVEDLVVGRRQFNHPAADNQSVRWFILNALQNTIYNHGQLATLFLTLAPEGAPPYGAPKPQAYYDQLRKGWKHHIE